jgi:flagellar biosynthesis component FlhA
MGIYFNNSYIQRFICCNYYKAENKLIIVNLDEKNEAIIEDNSKEKTYEQIKPLINNNYKQNDSSKENKINNKNEIVVFKFQSKFKPKKIQNSLNPMNNKINNINDNKIHKNNIYKSNNEHIDKLINFTNINIKKLNNSSSTPK